MVTALGRQEALPLTEEQKAVRAAARDFAHKHLAHDVIERDEEQRFPAKAVQIMGELGFMGMMTPAEYGGGGMDTVAYVLAIEEIAAIDASAAVIMSVNNSLVQWVIHQYGSDYLKNTYLPLLAQGKSLGAFCLSEPEAGSDATSQRTTARRQGDHYVLKGVKNWITNGGQADFYVVIAQSDPDKGYKGINAFLVERKTKGVVVGKKENKLGIRSSDTHSVMFEGAQVPVRNRIGDEGKGFNYAMQILNGGRIGIAAQAVGIARGATQAALRYAQTRHAFGQAIAKHQAIQFKLARMATHLEAAHQLTLQAARAKDAHIDYSVQSATAKLFASEVAMKTTAEAIQIHGGYGYVKEYHVERMMRDAKITEIYEGTSEIQKILIARHLLS